MAVDLGSFSNMFSGFNFSNIIDKIYFFIGILLLAAILGGIMFLAWKMKKAKSSEANTYKIGWWEEVHEELSPNDMDDATELTIPGSALKVFYVKKKDLWLPRFARGVTKRLFYVAITPNRQMVNFKLKALSKDLKEAGLDYDHTDMLFAAENMREFVKRNYKDKSIKWWQLYKDTISTLVHIFIHTFSLVLIIYMLRGFVGDLSSVAATINEALKTTCANAAGSGIVG